MNLERFIGCKVRATIDRNRAHLVVEGIVVSAREKQIEIDEPVAAQAVKGVLLDKDGKAQGEEEVYHVGDTNVLYRRSTWPRKSSFSAVIDLPRASLVAGDIILYETDHGIFGRSVAELVVIEITNILSDCLSVCISRDGYDPQVIQIRTNTVPVILGPTE